MSADIGPDLVAARLLFDSGNANNLLGLKLVRIEAASAEVHMPVLKEHIQEKHVVHGGIIAMLADTACVYTFLPSLDDSKLPGSIEFKLNFLNPAFLDRGDLIATAAILKRGKYVIVCESNVTQDSKTIAKGLFTYLVADR